MRGLLLCVSAILTTLPMVAMAQMTAAPADVAETGQREEDRYQRDDDRRSERRDRRDRRSDRDDRRGGRDDRRGGDSDTGEALDDDISTIIVTARRGDDSYASPSSVGSKVRENPRDIPQSIAVISRQRLEDQNLRTSTEALAQIPGFNATSPEGRFTLRGFDTGVSVDGAPSGSVAGRTDVDVEAFERVEVLKGAAALLQGNGQPGGVVNYVFKKPSRTFALSGKLGVGTYNNLYGGLDIGGPLIRSGSLRARGVAFYEDRDLYTRPEFRRRLTLYGTVQYDLTPRTTASLGYHWQKTRSSEGFRQGLPSYSDGTLLDVSPRTSLSQDWNRWTKRSRSFLADIEHRFGNDWIAKVAYRRGRAELPSVLAYPGISIERDGPQSACINAVPGAGDILSEDYQDSYVYPGVERGNPRFGGLRCMHAEYYNDRTGTNSYEAWVSGKITLAGIDQRVLFGYNRREELFSRSQAMSVPGEDFAVDVFDPNPRVRPRPNVRPSPDEPYSKTTDEGFYGRVVLSPVAWLKVPVGGRVSWVTGSWTGDVGAKVSPYYGVVAEIDRSLSVYGSYVESFETPGSGNELVGGGMPPPVEGRQYEFGLKGDLFHGVLQYSAAYFDILRTNQTSAAPGRPNLVVLTGDRTSRGFEAQVNGRIARGFEIGAGYTYTDAKVKDGADGDAAEDYTGQRVEMTPRHAVNIFGTYEFYDGSLEGLRLGGGVRGQSRQLGLLVCPTPELAKCGNLRLEGPGYTTASLLVAYRLNHGLELSLNADNFFDRTYWQAVETRSGGNYYGSPRQIQLTLRSTY